MQTKNIRITTLYIIGVTSLLLLIGCSNVEPSDDKKEINSVPLLSETPEVSVIQLESKPFYQELVSNGRLKAGRMVDLYFKNGEPVDHIYVRNGQRVKKGDKLAKLNDFKLIQKTRQALVTLEKSRLEMADLLIGQGYAPEDSMAIPASIMKLVRIKSGYEQSLSNYELAWREEKDAILKAPFDGVVANLFMTELNTASLSEPFCRLIDPESLEAAFTVLENELPLICKGDQVRVRPFAVSGQSYMGTITEVNPLVETSGMVQVRAAVQGNERLFEGMNLQISILRVIPNRLVVPKTAVVMRSGKQVLFTYDKGKAMWNYVTTELENETEYSVTGKDIKAGDWVITNGNINLAHEAPVNKL